MPSPVGRRRRCRCATSIAAVLVLPVLAGCGGGKSHTAARTGQLLPTPTSAGSSEAVSTSAPSTTPSSTPAPSTSAPASPVPVTPTAAPSAAPSHDTGSPSAQDLANLRTNAMGRCQALIANAPAAGPCEYIRTIVPASDSSYVYVEVAASGHDGTLFHGVSGSYAPVFDNGDQPPPCSKVTAAGVPLAIWADVVHQIENSAVGDTCYS